MSADGTVSLALFKFWLKESKSLRNSPTSGNRVEIIIHSIALFTASILSKHIQLQSEISSFHFGFFINACTLQLTNQMKYPHKIRINVSWEIFLYVIQTIHVRWFCGCTRWAMMRELLFWIWFTSFHSSFVSSTSVHSSDIDFFMQTYGLKLTSFDSSRPVSHSLLSRRKNEIQHCFPGYFVNDAHNFQMNFFSLYYSTFDCVYTANVFHSIQMKIWILNVIWLVDREFEQMIFGFIFNSEYLL